MNGADGIHGTGFACAWLEQPQPGGTRKNLRQVRTCLITLSAQCQRRKGETPACLNPERRRGSNPRERLQNPLEQGKPGGTRVNLRLVRGSLVPLRLESERREGLNLLVPLTLCVALAGQEQACTDQGGTA